MSNKPKGVFIHKDNILTPVEIAYNKFIRDIKNYSRKNPMFGKHVGSKRLSVLKQRIS